MLHIYGTHEGVSMPRMKRADNIELRIIDAARRISWKKRRLKAIYLLPRDMDELRKRRGPLQPMDNIGGVPVRVAQARSMFYDHTGGGAAI